MEEAWKRSERHLVDLLAFVNEADRQIVVSAVGGAEVGLVRALGTVLDADMVKARRIAAVEPGSAGTARAAADTFVFGYAIAV
jgi:hypothetical protein